MRTAVTSLRTELRVSMRLCTGQADTDDPSGLGSTRSRARAGRGAASEASMSASNGWPGSCPASRRARTRGCGRTRVTPHCDPSGDLGAGSAREQRDQDPDGSRAEHQCSVVRRECRRLRGTKCVPPGSTDDRARSRRSREGRVTT